MRKTIVQLALLGIIGTVAYLAIFKRDEVIALFNKVKKEAQGYKEARTPDEAMEYYNKALEARNYEAAADYATGEYGVQLRKVAGKAEKLAKAIDDFKYAMEKHNVKSDKVTRMLADKEPFPKKYKVDNIKQVGEDGAVAAVQVESGVLNAAVTAGTINLKRENDQWKLMLPFTPVDRARFDHVNKYGQD
jgi:tetratricopeptide (TPR) repeat protein